MKKLLLLLTLISAAIVSAAEFKIADNDKAQAGIIIPANAKPIVKLAAGELASYLQKMTGAKFTVGTKSTFKNNFKLGFGNPKDLEKEEFVIRTNGNDLEIYGHDTAKKAGWFYYSYDCDEKGTLMGVYHFLDMLGVRWPFIGFEHVPAKKTLAVNDLDIRFKPYFKERIATGGAWGFRKSKQPDATIYAKHDDDAFKYILRNFQSPRKVVVGCHSESALGLKTDPNWLKDITRVRLSPEGKRTPGFSCWTHPDVLKMWMQAADDYFAGKSIHEAGFKYGRGPYGSISKWPYPFLSADEFMIDPCDHYTGNDGRCYCERCNDFRKKYPCADDSEIIWRVIAQVAEHIHKKYPGKYISTLIYPPKREIPNIKIPPNIRVKICISGPKEVLSPKSHKFEVSELEKWHKFTGNPVSIWSYHLVGFNQSMPDIVETYPRKINQFIQAIRGKSIGMFMEVGNGSFTRDILDRYIYYRLMKNPDLDVEKEIDKFFAVSYGPAAKEAQQFFGRLEYLFEDFWKKTVVDTGRRSLVTPWPRNNEIKKKLWEITYTTDELKSLGKIVDTVVRKTAGTKYAQNGELLKKYVYDPMVETHKLTLGKDIVRATANMTAVKVAGAAFPADSVWAKAPAYNMIPGSRFQRKTSTKANFKLASSDTHFFIRGEFFEDDMDKTVFKKVPGKKDSAVWNDNCVELYIAPIDKVQKNFQLLVNDRGEWSCNTFTNGVSKWGNLPNVTVKVDRLKDRWIAKVAVPYASLGGKGTELRFNPIRTHRVAGKNVEYSTFCPLAVFGVWHIPENYGTVIVK